MIDLYCATVSDERGYLGLQGVTREALLSWGPLSGELLQNQALQDYLDGGVLGATYISLRNKLVQIVRSTYRPEQTFSEFMNVYKPLASKSVEGKLGFGVGEDGAEMVYYGLETYGNDLKLVQEYASRGCVATVIDNDRGGHSLVGGMRFVNRIYYVVTQIPVPELISIDMEAQYEDPIRDDAYERSCEYAINQVFTQCDLPWNDLLQALEDAVQSGQGGGFAYIEDIDSLEDVLIWEQFEDESAAVIQGLLEDFQESAYKLIMDFAISRGITHQ